MCQAGHLHLSGGYDDDNDDDDDDVDNDNDNGDDDTNDDTDDIGAMGCMHVKPGICIYNDNHNDDGLIFSRCDVTGAKINNDNGAFTI